MCLFSTEKHKSFDLCIASLVLINKFQKSFKGSGAHGIQSLDLDTSYSGFVFEGDVLGCEDGWTGFRENCYYRNWLSKAIDFIRNY